MKTKVQYKDTMPSLSIILPPCLAIPLPISLYLLHFSSLPIDLWVVVLEPGITEDHVLPSKAEDSEERPFGVGFVIEDYVYHFRDLTCLIGGAIHVVHWYGARDAPGVNTFRSDKVSIYEVACSSGVQKRLDRIYFTSVSSTDLYRKDDRHSAGVKGVGEESSR